MACVGRSSGSIFLFLTQKQSLHPGPRKANSPKISVAHDIHIIGKGKYEYDIFKKNTTLGLFYVIENVTK